MKADLEIKNVHAHCRVHTTWDRRHAPLLEIEPGLVVEIECLDASHGVMSAEAGVDDVGRLDESRANPVTGPIFVKGARPGRTLAVEILSFHPTGWGWTANIPGFGLLADQFTEPELVISRASPGGEVLHFIDGVEIPIRPFAGTMGVAPAAGGPQPMIPPLNSGGNLDIRHLVAGSTLYLPIGVEGALFSVGDTHLAQGDGEVCGTAVESPMSVRLRFHLADREIHAPEYRIAGGYAVADPKGFHVTTGVGPDLMRAAREAVLRMVDYLAAEMGMSPMHAYLVGSVAGDLSISEVVDAPNWVVSFRMPLSIFR